MAKLDLNRLIVISAILLLILIFYGEWQDAHMEVPYTDVDYLVFSDASTMVASGRSPFDRPTYRYSPLLAFLLLPNSWIHRSWGMLLFSSAGISRIVNVVAAAASALLGQLRKAASVPASLTVLSKL